MRVENTADEVIIALPKGIITRDEIQRLLNYFRYKELVAKSQATETQIAELTSEIKKGVAKRSAKSRKLSEEQIRQVQIAEQQIIEGKYLTHEAAQKQTEEWLKD